MRAPVSDDGVENGEIRQPVEDGTYQYTVLRDDAMDWTRCCRDPTSLVAHGSEQEQLPLAIDSAGGCALPASLMTERRDVAPVAA